MQLRPGGVVSKRRDRPYRAGRGADWTKAKCLNRQEFVIVGFTPPQGARRGIGALLLGYHRNGKLLYAGKVGTGFSERTLEDLRGRLEPLGVERPAVDNPPREARVTWVEPTLVAEVEFANWTREGLFATRRSRGCVSTRSRRRSSARPRFPVPPPPTGRRSSRRRTSPTPTGCCGRGRG